MIALWLGLAFADVTLEGVPALDEEVLITVTDDRSEPVQGATVRVIHRAGLADATEMAIGITDARGQVPWTPHQSGTATVVAGDEELRVQVGWDQIPSGPALMLAFLVLAAVGSAGYGLRPRS